MLIKGIIDEDFVNYKQPSMVIMCSSCSFKCDKECGKQVCQNSTLANSPDIDIRVGDLVERYINNNITKAVVFGGLEPFYNHRSCYEILKFISILRYDYFNNDTVVIYTGFTENEIQQLYPSYYEPLTNYCHNIVIKYGRYIPNQKPHYDEILGIKLASDNQYAKEYK